MLGLSTSCSRFPQKWPACIFSKSYSKVAQKSLKLLFVTESCSIKAKHIGSSLPLFGLVQKYATCGKPYHHYMLVKTIVSFPELVITRLQAK